MEVNLDSTRRQELAGYRRGALGDNRSHSRSAGTR
jgi:hypothetical protein